MKFRFSIMVSILIMFLAVVCSACSKEEKDTSASSEADGEQVSWELSEEEKKDNWKAFKEIGFKVQMPREISANKDVIRVDRLGDDEDENSPIYNGYLYSYYALSSRKAYDAIIADESLDNEAKAEQIKEKIIPQIKEIFALFTLRESLLSEENTIEKILQKDEVKFAKVEEVRRDGQYVYAVAFSDGENVEGLSEEDATRYKSLVEVAKAITKEAQTRKPISKNASLQGMKGLTFDTLDLEGKQITHEVLKNAKVTMVNIWATWCPPCKAELPDIGRLAKSYKEKGGQVIAICSDVTEEDTSPLEEAKEIIKDAECEEVIVLRNNKSLASIYVNIRAFPTTLFFDSNGNVIAPIIVGGRSEADFAKVFDECLEKTK